MSMFPWQAHGTSAHGFGGVRPLDIEEIATRIIYIYVYLY